MPEPVVLEPYDPAWPQRYEEERRRIAAALGEMVEGGVLDGLEHIGSTSVPGLRAKPCIDIMARVHPLPLPQDKVDALVALGYEYLGEHGFPGRHYFRRGPHDVHLHVVGFESDYWARHRLFRDYLRAHPEAARRYQALKLELAARFREDRAAYTEGKSELVEQLEREAFTWHVAATGFAPVEAVAAELAGLEVRWLVSSGWALDLFLEEPSRYHDDLDIVVFRQDQHPVQRRLLSRGWRLDKVTSGGGYRPWAEGEWLGPEVHQVHARRGGAFLDLLLSPRKGDAWVYRRDERLALPLQRAIRESARGWPYLAPEAVLLFKSKTGGTSLRPRDQRDFERVLPRLSPAARQWLEQALGQTDAEHPWLEWF